MLRKLDKYKCCECQFPKAASSIVAAPNHGGQLSYIHMPNAAAASYERRLGNGLYLYGAASLRLHETGSSVKQARNSNLPRGRSDMAQHLRGGRFSLRRILLNRYDNRPEIEVGTWYTHFEGKKRSDAFFQPDHAAIAFAAVTPFAGEYDAPWLYSVAAPGSAGKVADKYWMSDTDAGDTLGYAVGGRLWYPQCDQSKSSRSINLGFKEVSVTWQAAH